MYRLSMMWKDTAGLIKKHGLRFESLTAHYNKKVRNSLTYKENGLFPVSMWERVKPVSGFSTLLEERLRN